MIEKGVLIYAVANSGIGVIPLTASASGGLLSTLIDPGGFQPQAIALSADAISAADIGLVSASFEYGFNGATWDRLIAGANNADAVALLTKGVLAQAGYNYAFNGATWDRVSSGANNADAVAVKTKGVVAQAGYLYSFNGATYDRVRSQANNADAIAVLTVGVQANAAYRYSFNGATWDRTRGANVFKSVVVSAAGDTTIWTPAAGKKVRLMGLSISASGTAAALVANLLKIQDAAAGPNLWQGFIAVATTVTGDTQIYVDFGQGQLLSAINHVLNANLATAFATGGAAVNAWGTEE
jgi:hypothetical protein